jgi:predicted dehydrogenase
LGEFIARYFHQQGALICGIVGTSRDSVDETCLYLEKQYGFSTTGFTSLTRAIIKSKPTVVVIASPNQLHLRHLQVVTKYKLSCLCEKPLFWKEEEPFDPGEVEALVDRFCKNGKLLQLVTQWPCTLDEFYSVYPGAKKEPLERFSMLLGPVSTGKQMVVDAMPHVLSMIHTLTGVGSVRNVVQRLDNKERFKIIFDYMHAGGRLEVHVTLVQTPESPRPAGYALDGNLVWRRIFMKNYQMYFSVNSGDLVPVKDPLKKLVRRFLDDLESGQPTDKERLIASMTDLNTIVENLRL